MRNNKKGFTLTELIAVIVILSLIISLATISVLAIRKNVLKKDYNNLVTYLETKAAEYANETNITTISVEDLIKEGKISPDDQNTVYNPETKESMNCYIIKSTFENGKYTSTLSTNLGMSNGKCNIYEKTDKYEICRYDESTKKCTSFKSTDWFKEDISLSIKYTNDKNNTAINSQDVTFNWTSTNGFSSSEKIIKTETNLINQSTYKCEVTEGNSQGEVNGKVNIDKQAPAIDEIELNTGWAAKKDVIIKANDMGGSGISGFALVKENETCQKYTSDNKFEIKEEGTYKYCVKDVAGNITTDTIKIENIDSSKPATPVITASDGRSQDKWHAADFTLAFSSQIENSKSTITYYFSTSKNNLVLIGNEVAVNSSYHGKTMYVKACNEAGTCSDIVSYKILIDTATPVRPTITASDKITSNKWHANQFKTVFTSPGETSKSKITYYYGYDSNNLNKTGNNITIPASDSGKTLYVKACNEAQTCGEVNSYIIKIDTATPVNPTITPSDGIGQSSWHKANFTLSFTSPNEKSKSTITYYFGTASNSLNLNGQAFAINSGHSRKTIYVKACNEAKICSGVSSYTVLYDNTAPTYTSGGSIGQGSVSKPSYTDNAGGSGNVTVYTCVTTGKVPTNTDSCFSSSQTTYSYSCGTTFRLYSYAVDAAGNKSAVYDHATNNGATYYKSCYSGGGSSYGGGGSSGGGSHSSSCNTSCQMKKNSEAWHNTTNQAERDRLHRENQRLAEKNNSCGSGCSFDSGSGNWKNSSGKNLYEVSGGKKR